MHKIVICDGDGKTTLLPFLREEYSIGRCQGNTIRLTDRNISRCHARLFRDEQGRFFVEDLGSRNGIRVEGKNIRTEIRSIALEDRVGIGDCRISISMKRYPGIPLGVQVDPRTNRGVGKVTSHARIVMVEGPSPGLEVNLVDELYIVGRSDRANIHIEHPSISRAHARLEGSDDIWVISDLDSINGIHVNGEQVDDYPLKAGDRIDFGKIQFRFVAPGEPYDYETSRKRDDDDEHNEEEYGKRFILVSVIVLLLLMLGGWIYLHFFAQKPPDAFFRVEDGGGGMSSEYLWGRAQASLSTRQWELAANLLIQADERQPERPEISEMRKKAIMEMNSHMAMEAALRAVDLKMWEEAIEELKKIPPDSEYYNFTMLREVGDTLCDDIYFKAEFMISVGDVNVRPLIDAMDAIPEASDVCLERALTLRSHLQIE